LTSTFPGQDAAVEIVTDRAALKIEALAAEEQWLIIAPQYSRTFRRAGTRPVGRSGGRNKALETDLKQAWEQS
jgi:hypothetical protein